MKFGTKASSKKGLSVSNEFDDIPRDAFAYASRMVTTLVEFDAPSMNQDDLVLVNIIDEEGDYCSQPFIDHKDFVDAEQPNAPQCIQYQITQKVYRPLPPRQSLLR